MTTLERILNPKSEVENGWADLLKKAHNSVFPVFDPEDQKITPYIEVTLTNLRHSDRPQQHDYKGQLVYTSWSGTMTSRVVTNRNTNSEKHPGMVGSIIVESGLFVVRFPTVLQFHAVLDMRQSGLIETTDGTSDRTEISHEMLIVARDDVWDGVT